MDLTELLLFAHVVAAVLWIGSGFLLQVLASRANQASDDLFLAKLMGQMKDLSQKLFIPASMAVLIFGLAMTIEAEEWSFSQLWIVLGLVGYFATMLTGMLVLGPSGERLGEQMARDGGMSAEARVGALRLLALARIDLVVLLLVIADMVLKPTADDVGILAAMAIVLVGGVAFTLMKVRALDSAPSAAAA
jgi:hypothetical protein